MRESKYFSERVRVNTIYQLMFAFGTSDRPVYFPEFSVFWESLTPEEKKYYTHASIK